MSTTNTALQIAEGNAGGSHPFEGIIDEIRISSGTRTAQWKATEYNMQSDLEGFVSLGTQESISRGQTIFGIENIGYNTRGDMWLR